MKVEQEFVIVFHAKHACYVSAQFLLTIKSSISRQEFGLVILYVSVTPSLPGKWTTNVAINVLPKRLPPQADHHLDPH